MDGALRSTRAAVAIWNPSSLAFVPRPLPARFDASLVTAQATAIPLIF
jgi:hypothetical protein